MRVTPRQTSGLWTNIRGSLLALVHPIGYVVEVQQAGFVQFRLKVARVDYGPGQSVGASASELLETGINARYQPC